MNESPSAILSHAFGAPIVSTDRAYTGQLYVRSGAVDDDGYTVELFIPTTLGSAHVRCACELPAGWSARLREVIAAHNDPAVSGPWEPCGYLLPSGHYFPPAELYPASAEVGDLASTLGGALGGILGAIGGGPAGAAAGAAGGSALGRLFGGSDAPAARPSTLPAVGSLANRRRILEFLGISPGLPAAAAVAKLRDGAGRAWDPGDLADTRALLAAAEAMGPATLDDLDGLANAATPFYVPAAAAGGQQGGQQGQQGNALADVLAALARGQQGGQQGQQGGPQIVAPQGSATALSQGAAAALAALLSGSQTPQAVAPILASLGALQRGLAASTGPAAEILSPSVLALMGDSLSNVSVAARALSSDPTVHAAVDAAVQRSAERQARALELVRAMLAVNS